MPPYASTESFCQQIGKTGGCGCCFCQSGKLDNIVRLLSLRRLLGLPFLVRNKLACFRVALEGVGSYVLPGLETYAPVESFDEGGAHSGHVDGQFDFGGRVRIFFGTGQLELDFAHVGLGVFAGEVLAGGNGSRCEGSGSQEAKEKVEISGVGG